jgi:hypothetical protein
VFDIQTPCTWRLVVIFKHLAHLAPCITAHSATLIDNIFTNHLTQNLFSGIIINDLSDHLPVFVYVFTETPPPCKRPFLGTWR